MSKLVKLGGNIVKINLLSSIQQVATAFLEFPSSKTIFSQGFENDFPMNDFLKVQVIHKKQSYIYKTRLQTFFKTQFKVKLYCLSIIVDGS